MIKEKNTSTTNKFTGATKDMNGRVFQGFGETSKQRQYSETIEELESYITKPMDFLYVSDTSAIHIVLPFFLCVLPAYMI